jgi:hypothetical protein
VPLYRVVIQELPEPRNAEEPGLVGRVVRSLDVVVDAESPEEAVEKGWEEWDTKHPGGRPEAGRYKVFDPVVVEE